MTTATDVYALGALLYLLLSGRHPAASPGASPADLLRAILETETGRLSDAVHDPRLRRELRGDLDLIVARTLMKRPEERYASVDALAEDLRRYLAREPILARKLVRRNTRSLAAAAVAVLALAGIVAFFVTRDTGENSPR